MPLMDITKPEMINFLLENYEKTALLRMRWNNKHADKLNFAAKLHREEKGYNDIDIFKEAMVSSMANATKEYEASARNRRLKPFRDGIFIPRVADMRKGHSIVDLGLGDPAQDPRLGRPDSDLTIDPIMRPVDPKQKKILYKGKPDFGRQVYLKNRYKRASPEDRYYFAESSSWDYGWRLNDSFFKRNVPTFGRVCRMEREASRSGPQPDPDHYKSVITLGIKIC